MKSFLTAAEDCNSLKSLSSVSHLGDDGTPSKIVGGDVRGNGADIQLGLTAPSTELLGGHDVAVQATGEGSHTAALLDASTQTSTVLSENDIDSSDLHLVTKVL